MTLGGARQSHQAVREREKERGDKVLEGVCERWGGFELYLLCDCAAADESGT